jgi:hypothetical protein
MARLILESPPSAGSHLSVYARPEISAPKRSGSTLTVKTP